MSDGKFLPRPFRFRKHLIINCRGREKRVGKQKLCAKMKHITFTFLLTVLLSMAGAKSFAQTFVVGGIKYSVMPGNKVQVVSNNNTTLTGSIAIPESVVYEGTVYSVTGIGGKAFYGCTGLTSVAIPNSVTGISDNAFRGCTGLTSITIPNSVTYIGKYVFQSCGLTTITIPNSVTSIGNQVFNYCKDLTSVTIGNNIKEIGYRMFYDCTKLSSIIIPNSVTSIGINAFHSCSGLTSITIPNSVTKIDGFAFAYCKNLASVTIGSSVTSIGNMAFGWCSTLTHIISLATVPPVCNVYGVFDTTAKSTCRLSVPEGSVADYKTADVWKDFYNIDGEATGIDNVTKNADAKAIESIYDLNGQLQQGLRHELNIVRMSDGTVRKTMMK